MGLLSGVFSFMTFDRKRFFAGVKDRIDSTLDQSQVNGLEFLITHFESDVIWKDVRHAAYALATIFHETAGSFQPVEEGYYLGSKAKAFQKKLRYYPYFGRGYVQLTWKKNYDQAGKALNIDLVGNPDLALEPETAFKVLTLGLFRGWFGGRLTTYINSTKTDYVGARHCVNGTDKAGLIAGYAKSFEKILRNSAAPDAQDPTGDTPKDKADTSNSLTPDNAPTDQAADAPVIQNADQIINTGDQAAQTPPPQDVTMNAPKPMGSVQGAGTVTILGIAVPSFIVAFFKMLGQWFEDGKLDMQKAFDTVVSLMQNNMKYILILAGLVVGIIALKKIERLIVFLFSMLTHAIPSWNSVSVAPPAAQPPQSWWHQWRPW